VPRPVPTPRLVDPPPTELALAAGPSSALVDSSPDLQPRSVARTDPKPERAPAVPEESAPEPAAARAVPPSDEPAPPAPSPKRELASASGAPNGRTEPSKIRVEKTLWHPQADRRVAVVTLPGHEGPLRVREGEVVGEVLVSKIEPSGVVFTGERGDVRRAVGAR